MIRRHLPATRKRYTVPLPEVQILGSLIGAGLSDTGTADATNLLVSTQQAFSGLDWIRGAITPADINATDPLSGSTASTLTETSSTSTHYIVQQFLTAVVTEVSFSFYLKQGLRTRAALYIYDGLITTTYVTATFDLAGGAIGIAAAVAGTFTTPLATITAEGNGFYLCTVSANLVGGSGYYLALVNADAGSGSGAASLSYAGNTSSAAMTIDFAGVWVGAPGTYIPLNANDGGAASTIQQAFSPNGGTTSYWGTQTPSAYVAFDAGVPVVPTRHRFAPRPASATEGVGFYAPDYSASIAGALIQTSVSDNTFASPTTVDTIPAQSTTSYYPRHWLSERTIPAGPAARYIRFKPPSVSFGGLSEWQVFAKASPLAPACPVQPVISPNGGRFPGLSAVVTMTSLTPGAGIYYNVGVGSPPADPTPTSSRKYTGPFIQAIGSGSTVYIKSVAHLSTLSAPISLVTTSAPFCGYGFKPNTDEFDQYGNLIEAHSGTETWDPNTSAYYKVGVFMNNNTQKLYAGGTYNELLWPVTYLYTSTDLMNWSIVANIGVSLFSGLTLSSSPVIIPGRFHLLYNAANNNYVIWFLVASATSLGAAFVATASNILGPWTVNSTPASTNFADFDILVDSDGVSAYCFWRANNNGLTIQGLNSTFTGLSGASINPGASFNTREGPVAFKYPNVTGGTYFCITSVPVPYDSVTTHADLRYIYSNGSSPIANTWTTLPGAGCFASDPYGTNYNGQGTFHLIPDGKVQPMIGMDYWIKNPLYNSRAVYAPINITGNTLQIQVPTTWDPSLLASGYTLQTLTLSASTFVVGDAQGTVIGTVNGTTPTSTLTLTNSNGSAVQLVAGVIQVGPTPPGTSGTFNIQLTETISPGANSPNVTTLSITENAVGGSLSGSVATFTTAQNINLTSLGPTDWAMFGYTANAAAINRKATGGSLISALSQVGSFTLLNYNGGAGVVWLSSCNTGDGSPTATVTNEGYAVYATEPSGNGMSFHVPAGTSPNTLLVYVVISSDASHTTQGKLTATLSDGSAGPYSDTTLTSVNGTNNLLGVYTLTYQAASGGQHLTVQWVNNTNTTGQNVQIFAAALT